MLLSWRDRSWWVQLPEMISHDSSPCPRQVTWFCIRHLTALGQTTFVDQLHSFILNPALYSILAFFGSFFYFCWCITTIIYGNFLYSIAVYSIMRSFGSLQVLRASRACRTPVQQTRQFHPTRPALFLNEALEASSGFIQAVHSVSGLPWVASIPLTALIVRMTVAMPLQMYTKIQARKEQDLAPLLTSWGHHYQKEIKNKVNRSENEPMLVGSAIGELAKNMATKKRSLHRDWGVHRFWKPVNFLQMPVWIAIMESLRAMSGNNRGLVPYLLSLLEPNSTSIAPSHLAVEPSLATEGAFWFPDLLAGDPTGILPIALTASILFNIRTGWKAMAFKDMADLPRSQLVRQGAGRALRLLLQALALNIGVSSYLYEMPAALMIYWITSTNVATMQSFVLDKFLFKRPALKPRKQLYVGLKSREAND